MDIKTWTSEFWLKNEENCLSILKKSWDSLPLLNVNDTQYLTDNTLVRFRGMIQDMYNPEYYMEKYEVINEVSKDTILKNGKYVDSADCKDNEVIDFQSSSNVTGERHTFVAISVPGVNKWVDTIEVEKYKINDSNSYMSSGQQAKRSLDTNDMESETAETNEPSTSKKQCIKKDSETKTNSTVSQDHILNFPLPDESGKACHLKIYLNADALKINEVFDFIGFLSVDPILTHPSYHDTDIDSEMEVQTHNPPPSLVPRIHCVYWNKVDHCNPLVAEVHMELQKMQFLRKELHFVLTQLLLGDALTAEYLMYHLISAIYLRKDLLALGKFSLNISNIPVLIESSYADNLYKFIELLLPKSYFLPMTLENMNEFTFIPKKDYECNRLTSGLLQLSNNTHLVLDETKLTPGKLNESGVKAVSALANVINCQKMSYDFRYYQMEFDCDIPFLVLSEGKSLLPSDCHVVMKPDEVCVNTFGEIIDAANQFLKPELINDIRAYLTIARMGQYEIADNVQELIQDEFVKLRLEENITADDLHNLLVLARLVCLSEGKTNLDDQYWKRTCELESQRKERLKK